MRETSLPSSPELRPRPGAAGGGAGTSAGASDVAGREVVAFLPPMLTPLPRSFDDPGGTIGGGAVAGGAEGRSGIGGRGGDGKRPGVVRVVRIPMRVPCTSATVGRAAGSSSIIRSTRLRTASGA